MGAMVRRAPAARPSSRSPHHTTAGSSTPRCGSPRRIEVRPLLPPFRACADGRADRQQFLATLTATLTKAVQTMLVHTSSAAGRTAVPPITNAAGISPFPVRVTVSVGGVEVA